MADNAHTYGFRFHRSLNGNHMPTIYEKEIATAYDSEDDTSTNVSLRIGDPLKAVSTGTVALALTTERVEWIAMGFSYVDATSGVRKVSDRLPNATAWTNEQDRIKVLCARAKEAIWKIDADDNTTATTAAAYRLLIGENAPHVVPGGTYAGTRYADPYLDISLHATTVGLEWRILGWEPRVGMDLSGANVTLLVQVNDSTEAGSPATNVTAV